MANRGQRVIVGFIMRNLYTIINIVIAFYMMPFMLHHLGDRMYGLWILMGSFVGYFGFLDLGFSSAVSRYVARAIGKNDKDEINEIVNTAFVVFVCLSIILVIVVSTLVVSAEHIFKDFEEIKVLQILLICVGVNLTFSFPVRAFTGVINGNLQYKVSETIILSELLLRYGLIYIFFKLGFGIISLGVIVCAVALITHVAWIISAFKVDSNLKLNLKLFNKARLKELTSFSIYSFISRMGDLLINKTDAFVIAAFLGLTFNAHYAIPIVLMSYISNFISKIVGLIGPVISQDDGRNDIESIKQKMFLTIKIVVIFVVFFTSLAVFYGEHFIVRWVGSEYRDAYPVLVVHAITVLASNIMMPANTVLFNTSRHKYLAIIKSIEAGFNLILSLILVTRLGMVGVALGTLIPVLVMRLIFQPVYLCKEFSISFKKYYVDTLLKNMVIAAAPIVITYFILKDFAKAQYLTLIFIGAIHGIIYAVFIWFKGFSNTERGYFMKYLKFQKTVSSG